MIVGAGPAGLSAAARASKQNLNYLVLEKGAIGNTLDYHYQQRKFVMSQPAEIPIRSDIPFEEGSRESVLESWNHYVKKNKLKINENESVVDITKNQEIFRVKTDKSEYEAKNVVLAVGKLGNSREIKAEGANLDFIFDRLVDPDEYNEKNILVVGGGDSAVELALSLCGKNKVFISYRNTEFFRVNPELLNKVNEAISSNSLRVFFNSAIKHFEPGFSTISLEDRDLRISTDAVFVKIGAEVPRPFLEKAGVKFYSEDTSSSPIADDRFQTETPGLYVIGSVCGEKDLIKKSLNDGYEVIEYICGNNLEQVDTPLLRKKLEAVPGHSLDQKIEYISSKLPLFLGVERSTLRDLLIKSDVRVYKKGDFVFHAGDYSTSIFNMLEGKVQVLYEGEKESDIFLDQGKFFGEIALFADKRRTSSIRAVKESVLIETPRRAFLKIVKTVPSVKKTIDEVFTLNTLQTTFSIPQISDADRNIAAKLQVESFKKGEQIYDEGEAADSLYILRKGSVRTSKKNNEGKENIINYIHCGDYFGVDALIDSTDIRVAKVTASALTEVIKIPAEDFKLFINNYPELQSELQSQAERRVIRASTFIGLTDENRDNSQFISDYIKHGVIDSTDVLIIDEKKCTRCDNCVKACESTHNGQTRLDRIPGPSFSGIHVPVACRHCEGAPCLQDCPPGDAIFRASDGAIKIDEEKCIGCGNCASFCPYGVVFMVEKKEKPTLLKGTWQDAINLFKLGLNKKTYTEAVKGIAVKCDLCENISGGPACVSSCPTGAAIRVGKDYFENFEKPDE